MNLRRQSLSLRRGVSLVELMVSISLMTLMFAALTYSLYVTAKNTHLVREQAISQSQAASAAERITNTLRNAAGFEMYSDDEGSSDSLVWLKYYTPDPANPGTLRKGVISYEKGTINDSDGKVKIFTSVASDSKTTLKAQNGDFEFGGLEDFAMSLQSPTLVTLRIGYSYRGFISHDDSDIPADTIDHRRFVGEFLTDIIAKNHHPGEGVNYAATDSPFLLN